eukprot:TRINITY_DN145_c0_g1_i1.p1 TRINITY_DN145_c0_g1~~TRINITY_DN145_c0_g1_i1.p1  ORF type:complete len:497 (-),score=173.96 TRINITY_DN145_c0_g1_i1:88-1539(-)
MTAATFIVLLASVSAVLCNPTTQQLLANDLNVLNYALALERLEAKFYADYLAGDTHQNDFANFGGGVTYNYIKMIGAHETAHVSALETTIAAYGGQTIPECTYNFRDSFSTPEQFLAVAQKLENTGVQAYLGAANTIFNKTLLTVAATITTVEARHAAFLQYVSGVNVPVYPFANYTLNQGRDGFDVPVGPAAIIAAVSETTFLVDCGAIPVPVALPITLNPAVPNPLQSALDANDIVTLNYALTLEHLEDKFYRTYMDVFTQEDFVNIGLRAYDFISFQLIRDHEKAHVDFLKGVLQSVNAPAVEECTYDFKINLDGDRQTAFRTFIATATIFENLGVSAYDGAIKSITNKVYIQAAASIATIEARHAAYLNYLNVSATSVQSGPFYANGNPFPANTDTPLEPADVIAAAGSFITACPTGSTPTAPTVLFIQATNTTSSPLTTTTTSTTASPVTPTTGSGSSASSVVIGGMLAVACVVMALL